MTSLMNRKILKMHEKSGKCTFQISQDMLFQVITIGAKNLHAVVVDKAKEVDQQDPAERALQHGQFGQGSSGLCFLS
jgi:hypothetical protein